MRRLTCKLVLFFALLGLVRLFFNDAGETELSARRAAFAAGGYTAVFIGSSRTKMAVVPALFDALAGGGTKSYNFGIDAGVPPHTFDWAEELIDESPALEYVFFELSGGEELNERTRMPWRGFSWREYGANWRRLSFAESQQYHNRLAVDAFKPLAPSGEASDFTAYNLPLAEALERPALLAGRETNRELLAASARRNALAAARAAAAAPDADYAASLDRLVARAEAKGVRVYFFVPPRLQSDAELARVASAVARLDARHRLDADHAAPSLYRIETSADEYHLNHAGALRFTAALAKKFVNAR